MVKVVNAECIALLSRIQLILNFHTDHLWPFFASEASVYLGSSVGERSEPITRGPGAQPPAGSRGRAPGRGLGGAAPGKFLKNQSYFDPLRAILALKFTLMY